MTRTYVRRLLGLSGCLVASGLLAATLVTSPAQADTRQSAIIVDVQSKTVLYADDPDAPRYPASLTKMMTLYLAFDALDKGRIGLQQPIKVSAHAAAQPPSSLGLRTGEILTVEQAILAVVTKSANDAAVGLAEALADSERDFAEKMTARARSLGMNNTTFRNASGLPNKSQRTTARDMATLAMALWNNHRKYYHYFATTGFSFDGRNYTSHNHLLTSYEGADGIKTGYIGASGFNLVASAQRNGRRLVGVVFGGNTIATRDKLMRHLLDRGFARSPQDVDIRSASKTPSASSAVLAALDPVKSAVAAEGPINPDQGSNDGPRGGWAVQVGAFSRAAIAEKQAGRAMQLAPDQLGEGTVDVAARDKRSKLYRARLTGLTEEDAREGCRKLHKKKQVCTVIAE